MWHISPGPRCHLPAWFPGPSTPASPCYTISLPASFLKPTGLLSAQIKCCATVHFSIS